MAADSQIPKAFSAWHVKPDPVQIDHLSKDVTNNLELVTIPVPELPKGHVLVRVYGAALNYRDLLTITHSPLYPTPLLPAYSPCSDGAGKVVAAGAGSTWSAGDRVIILPNAWLKGTDQQDFDIFKTLGGGDTDGTLQEYMVVHEDGLIRAPHNLKLEEAAALMTAGNTAVYALFFGAGGQLKAGQTVLTQGTGGVSTFAIQFAAAAGATVIALSSTEEKLEIAKSLGATHTINYKTYPEWSKEVLRLTQGKGVDHVVDVGGSSTLKQSVASLRLAGSITVCGILGDGDETGIAPAIMYKAATVQGHLGSSKIMAQETVRLVEKYDIHPVIAKVWDFEESKKAFDMLVEQKDVGKVVIRVCAE